MFGNIRFLCVSYQLSFKTQKQPRLTELLLFKSYVLRSSNLISFPKLKQQCVLKSREKHVYLRLELKNNNKGNNMPRPPGLPSVPQARLTCLEGQHWDRVVLREEPRSRPRCFTESFHWRVLNNFSLPLSIRAQKPSQLRVIRPNTWELRVFQNSIRSRS